MQLLRSKGIRRWVGPKGAQHKITFGRGYQNGRPIRAIIRAGTVADCCQAEYPIPGFRLSLSLADRSYDSQAILQAAHQAEMRPAIAPKKNRKYQRNANQDWCQMQPRVENAVWHLKWWRGIATGCGKNSDSLLAAIQIGYIFLWATRDYTM